MKKGLVMKKRLKSCIIIICILLLLGVGYFIINDFSREAQPVLNPILGNTDMPHFILHEMRYDDFFQFIETPSVSMLNTLSHRENVLSLSEASSDFLPGLVRREIVSDDPVRVFEEPIIRFPNLSVDESLVRFAGDTAEIQTYLAEHGITSKIESAVALGVRAIPLTIWVQAGGENFFITSELQSGASVYRFYTHSEFLERFGVKKGTLIVNRVEIAHVEFHFDYVILPLVATLEALDADIRLLDDGTTLFAYNGVEFILDKTEPSFVEVGNMHNHFLLPPGGYMFLEVMGSEVMVDSTYTMRFILRSMGVEMHIDRDQMLVTIG